MFDQKASMAEKEQDHKSSYTSEVPNKTENTFLAFFFHFLDFSLLILCFFSSVFLCFFFSDSRRAERAMEHGFTHNSNEHPGVRPSSSLRSISRPTRKPRARRRSTIPRLHQHYRLLCSNGFSFRSRTSMQPSLRKQKLGPTIPLPPAYDPRTLHSNHTHKPALAEPRENHGVDGPRQSNHIDGRDVLYLFPARPPNEHTVAATEGFLKVTEGDETDDVLHAGGGDIPRAAESGTGGGDGTGGKRGCNGFGADEFEHDGVDGRVRVVVVGIRRRRRRRRIIIIGVEMLFDDEMEGWDWRGVWWVGPTDEIGSPKLFGDMFGVVVV